MGQLEATRVKLLKKWCGQPAGLVMTLIKGKADDLIDRGYAEEVDAKPKSKKTPVKNRAIQASSNE